MLTGALIAESLRVGATLDNLELTVQRLSRAAADLGTADQGQVWTLLEFTSDSIDPNVLAEKFSRVLDSPGWYASFQADGQLYVVFPGRVFRYSRDDDSEHEQALTYARSAGVPDEQCDWR